MMNNIETERAKPFFDDMFRIRIRIGDGEGWYYMKACVSGIDSHPWKIEGVAKDNQQLEAIFRGAFSEACEMAILAYKDKYNPKGKP